MHYSHYRHYHSLLLSRLSTIMPLFQLNDSITVSCNPCFRWSANGWSQKEWCYYILYSLPTTPPWLLTRPAVNFTLHCSDKSNTPPEIFKHRFYELCHEFKNYYRIFTDGSKEGNRVAAAVVHRDNTKCVRLPHAASIFRAELYALLLAIDVVRPALKTKQFCNLLYHLSLRATWSSLWFIFSAS